jgi:HSP20 family protein
MVTAERPRGCSVGSCSSGKNLDTDKIEANYHDGVLRLTIPVAEKQARRIDISHDADAAINA